jgi:hypothetical protein
MNLNDLIQKKHEKVSFFVVARNQKTSGFKIKISDFVFCNKETLFLYFKTNKEYFFQILCLFN